VHVFAPRLTDVLTTCLVSVKKVTERKSAELLQFMPPAPNDDTMNGNGNSNGPPLKRSRHESNGDSSSPWAEDLMVEVGRITGLLSDTIESLTNAERPI
jgi:hypothetical protein